MIFLFFSVQQLFQSIKDFDQQVKEIRSKVYHAGLPSSAEESIEKRLIHFEQSSAILQERSLQSFTSINNLKFDCEQILSEMKKLNDWFKQLEQQFNRTLPIHLSSAEEKFDAAKKMLVSVERRTVPYPFSFPNYTLKQLFNRTTYELHRSAKIRMSSS